MIPDGSGSEPAGRSIPRESGDDPTLMDVIIREQVGIPRESGDDPLFRGFVVADLLYSPRERG